MRRRGRLLSRISTVLLVLAGATWLLFLRPEPLGGSTTYVIVSGVSMEPTLENGDFVIARRQTDYEIGDIVVYAVPKGDVGAGSRIIHRIIDEDADRFVIQGDNPDIKVPDIWRPTAPEIEGKLWVAIPAVGRYLPLLRSPLILALLAGAFVFWVMYPSKERQWDTEASFPDERADEPLPEPVAIEERSQSADPAPLAHVPSLAEPVAGGSASEPRVTADRWPPVAAEASAGADPRKLIGVSVVMALLTILIWRYLRSR